MGKPNSEIEFRKIPSLYFLYEVSEDGRIVRNVKSKHQLWQDKDRGGYYRVSVFIKGKQVHRLVHTLVAECWHGAKPKGYECDHIDGNNHNNHYTNLRYVTREENLRKRVFTEEGKRHNGEVTRQRYEAMSPEQKRACVDKMLAGHTAEAEQRRINAVLTALAHPVTITKGGESIRFESKAKCSRYIAEKDGCSVGAVEYYLCQRRQYIHGYNVTYEK